MPRKEMDTPPVGGTPMPSEPMPTPSEPTSSTSPMTKAVMTLAVLLLLGASGTAGYFYKQLNDLKKNPNKVAQDETAATIAAVGKLIVLPSEQPTLATVTDAEKLKDQPFFANAKAGDKVLIYTTAKKAILYSPSENKIVEVAPVNIGDSTAAADSTVSGSSTTKTPTPKK